MQQTQCIVFEICYRTKVSEKKVCSSDANYPKLRLFFFQPWWEAQGLNSAVFDSHWSVLLPGPIFNLPCYRTTLLKIARVEQLEYHWISIIWFQQLTYTNFLRGKQLVVIVILLCLGFSITYLVPSFYFSDLHLFFSTARGSQSEHSMVSPVPQFCAVSFFTNWEHMSLDFLFFCQESDSVCRFFFFWEGQMTCW